VQDVLEALESFQAPGEGGKAAKSAVTAGAGAGATRSSGKRSDDAPLD
jgi:hypothetical protein